MLITWIFVMYIQSYRKPH